MQAYQVVEGGGLTQSVWGTPHLVTLRTIWQYGISHLSRCCEYRHAYRHEYRNPRRLTRLMLAKHKIIHNSRQTMLQFGQKT